MKLHREQTRADCFSNILCLCSINGFQNCRWIIHLTFNSLYYIVSIWTSNEINDWFAFSIASVYLSWINRASQVQGTKQPLGGIIWFPVWVLICHSGKITSSPSLYQRAICHTLRKYNSYQSLLLCVVVCNVFAAIKQHVLQKVIEYVFIWQKIYKWKLN